MSEMTYDTIQESDGAGPTGISAPKVTGSRRRPPADRKAFDKARYGLVAGALPKRYRWAAACVARFRRALEQAVLDARGEVGLMNGCHILTAARWERAALVAQRQLTDHEADLAPLERSKLAEQVASASAKRDAAVEKLRLPTSDGDWNPGDLYRLPFSTPVQKAPEAPRIDATPKASKDTPEALIVDSDARGEAERPIDGIATTERTGR